MSASRDEIRRALADVAERARTTIRSERGSRALRAGLDEVSAWAWLPALFVLAAVALGSSASVVCLVCAGLSILGGAILVVRGIVATRQVDVLDALGRLGVLLGDEDRLLTAHEFLATPRRDAFMEAAIDDAQPALQRARSATITAEPVTHRWSGRGRFGVALAVFLVVLAFVVDPAVPASPPALGSGIDVADAAVEVGEPGTGRDEPRPDASEPPTRDTTDNKPPSGGPQTSEEGAPGEIPDDSRETEGATGEGRSAEASASKGAGQSKGMPSPQGQVSVPPEREAKHKKRKPSETPDAAPTETKKPEDEQKSGSTAGSGAASGSNRNPSSSEWSSKDHVSETDDEAVTEDDDVDDEESDSEARGGAQPNLRDRRPPVNRDLAVGFGNEADEESNGRGGPGQQKKSRGTASLVLGVPIPDHVKGQPNAGRTKITQERVEPKDDEAPTVNADDHGSRRSPSGDVPRTRMTPWMRALVRSYFLELRKSASKDMP